MSVEDTDPLAATTMLRLSDRGMECIWNGRGGEGEFRVRKNSKRATFVPFDVFRAHLSLKHPPLPETIFRCDTFFPCLGAPVVPIGQMILNHASYASLKCVAELTVGLKECPV